MTKLSKQQIGKAVRDIRVQKGLSMQQLAKQLGMFREHLSRIEAGKRESRISTLEKIAEKLETTLISILLKAYDM